MAKERFDEIDVQRVNVIDADGTLRMVISNKERFPDAVILGRKFEASQREGPEMCGIIFFNDDGDECGGLMYGGSRKPDGTYWGNMHLAFDQSGNDQILALTYGDKNGHRGYGLRFHDRPETFPLDDVIRLQSMPEGPEKSRMLKELIDNGAFGSVRMFLGRTSEGQYVIALGDSKGRPRLRLSVDSADSPRIEVLDEAGTVVSTLLSADDMDRMADLENQLLDLRQEVQELKTRVDD